MVDKVFFSRGRSIEGAVKKTGLPVFEWIIDEEG
jgi:hypothetical protein